MADKDVYGGVIHLHILHYTMLDPIFGLGITKELRHHGYEFSAGALSSMLHGLKKKGYLTSRHVRTGHRDWRMYETTEKDCIALTDAKA